MQVACGVRVGAAKGVVSILTRPEGRVQAPPPVMQELDERILFQSSPGQKAGCKRQTAFRSQYSR